MRMGAVVYDDEPPSDHRHPRHSSHPRNTVFRVVYLLPHEDEALLDDPQWSDGSHCTSDACPCFGLDPRRKGRLVKLNADAPDFSQFTDRVV